MPNFQALLTLVIYIAPFLALGFVVHRWMSAKGVGLADTTVEGSPDRKRSRFLLGVWHHED